MPKKQSIGWQKLVEGYPWFVGEGRYPLPAYSEFMPSPRVGCSLYGDIDKALFAEDDPYGWRVPEIEEEYELRPGLAQIAKQVLGYLVQIRTRRTRLSRCRAQSAFARRESVLVARTRCAAGIVRRVSAM